MLYLLTSFGLCFSLLGFWPVHAAFQHIDQSCNKYGGANLINAAAAEALTAVNAAMTSMTPPRKPQFTRLLISMIGLPPTITDRDGILQNFYSRFRPYIYTSMYRNARRLRTDTYKKAHIKRLRTLSARVLMRSMFIAGHLPFTRTGNQIQACRTAPQNLTLRSQTILLLQEFRAILQTTVALDFTITHLTPQVIKPTFRYRVLISTSLLVQDKVCARFPSSLTGTRGMVKARLPKDQSTSRFAWIMLWERLIQHQTLMLNTGRHQMLWEPLWVLIWAPCLTKLSTK